MVEGTCMVDSSRHPMVWATAPPPCHLGSQPMILLSLWLGYWLASQTPNASRQGGAPSVCIGIAIQSAWNHCLCVPWYLIWWLGLGWATPWLDTVLANSVHIFINVLWVFICCRLESTYWPGLFLLFTTAKFCGPHNQVTVPPLWTVQNLRFLCFLRLFVFPHTTNNTTLSFQMLAANCTSSWGFTTCCPNCWD